MQLEDQILEDLSKNMASDMDKHILADVMIRLGWKPVTVDPWQHHSTKEITSWIEKNISGQHIKTGNRWVFEQTQDATIFALKWS